MWVIQTTSAAPATGFSNSYSAAGSFSTTTGQSYEGGTTSNSFAGGYTSVGDTSSTSYTALSQATAGATVTGSGVDANGTGNYGQGQSSSYSGGTSQSASANAGGSASGYTQDYSYYNTISESDAAQGTSTSASQNTSVSTYTSTATNTSGSINSGPGSVAIETTAIGTAGQTLLTYTTTFTYTNYAVPTSTTASTFIGASSNGSSTSFVTTTFTSSESTLTTTMAGGISETDNQYVSGMCQSTTQVAIAAGAIVVTQAYIFAASEQPWLISLSSSFSGIMQLSEFAQSLGSSYTPTNTNSTLTTIGFCTATTTFKAVAVNISYSTSTQTITFYANVTGTNTVLALSTPISDLTPDYSTETYTILTTSSTTYEDGFAYAGTSSTSQAGGYNNSTQVSSAFTCGTSTSVTTLGYSISGSALVITGSTTASTSTTASVEVQLVTSTTDGNVSTSSSSYGESSVGGVTSAEACRVTTVTTQTGTLYSASSFIPQATILEATFSPGVRCGTSGKYSSIGGPGGTVFYPFWSQVWGGLWSPMTYGYSTSSTYQNQVSTTDSADSDYTLLTGTGPTISASYRWSDSQVFMTTATGSGTDTASGSTAFSVQDQGIDSHSFFASRGAGVVAKSTDQYGDVYPALQGGDYVVGGTQWHDQSAQLWLGSGVWGMTTYDTSGGSSTSVLTITDAVSISVLSATSIVVVARPIPAWTCCLADPGDSCIAVFTAGN